MKINRRNFLLASSAALVASRTQSRASTKVQNPKRSQTAKLFSANGNQVTVYTTADKTNYRITATDKLSFRAAGQPKETQICVFVDPRKQFQTFLGIGGALTDAA